MTERTRLRAQLKQAWKSTIKCSYNQQLINSEHGLQVYFCAALLEEFEESGVQHRLFIEPKLTFANEARYPDIVICNTKSIIGIVELKYGPRVRPSSFDYNKDIKTFELAVAHASNLKISNDRFLGITIDNRLYPLAENAVLCWAGVYTGKEIDWRNNVSEKIEDNAVLKAVLNRFLQLSALTTKDEDPKICLD